MSLNPNAVKIREKFWSKFWISLYTLYIFTSPSAQDREKSARLFLPNRSLGWPLIRCMECQKYKWRYPEMSQSHGTAFPRHKKKGAEKQTMTKDTPCLKPPTHKELHQRNCLWMVRRKTFGGLKAVLFKGNCTLKNPCPAEPRYTMPLQTV